MYVSKKSNEHLFALRARGGGYQPRQALHSIKRWSNGYCNQVIMPQFKDEGSEVRF